LGILRNADQRLPKTREIETGREGATGAPLIAMSNKTTTEKQRRRLLADREESAREEYQRQIEAWQARVAVAAIPAEEDRIYEAAVRMIYSYSDRDRSLDQLRADFPNASDDVLERAYDTAVKLLSKSAEVATLYRPNQITHLAALQAIEEAFPRFSRHLYEAALGAGMFVTR
jgi:hypothetical protein